jgi:hypothetical protein
VGVLLGAPLTLLVVIARVGQQAHAIDESTGGALILLALLTAVLCPKGFRVLASEPTVKRPPA